jgi:hypothetical protein
MREEYKSLVKNGVWRQVDMSSNKNVVKFKWVYKVSVVGQTRSRQTTTTINNRIKRLLNDCDISHFNFFTRRSVVGQTRSRQTTTTINNRIKHLLNDCDITF